MKKSTKIILSIIAGILIIFIILGIAAFYQAPTKEDLSLFIGSEIA